MIDRAAASVSVSGNHRRGRRRRAWRTNCPRAAFSVLSALDTSAGEWTPNLETNTSHGRDEFSEVDVDAAVIDAALNQQFATVGQLMGISSRAAM